jgi:hypothetical protein
VAAYIIVLSSAGAPDSRGDAEDDGERPERRVDPTDGCGKEEHERHEGEERRGQEEAAGLDPALGGEEAHQEACGLVWL